MKTLASSSTLQPEAPLPRLSRALSMIARELVMPENLLAFTPLQERSRWTRGCVCIFFSWRHR